RPAGAALEQRGRLSEPRGELLVERPRGELAVEAARDELLDDAAGVARHGAQLDRFWRRRGRGGRRLARRGGRLRGRFVSLASVLVGRLRARAAGERGDGEDRERRARRRANEHVPSG